MTASDLDATLGERVRSKIEHGRGAQIDVNHINTNLHQPFGQGFQKRWTTESAIAPYADCTLTIFEHLQPKGLTQSLGKSVVNLGGIDASNIVGFKNQGIEFHECILMFFP